MPFVSQAHSVKVGRSFCHIDPTERDFRQSPFNKCCHHRVHSTWNRDYIYILFCKSGKSKAENKKKNKTNQKPVFLLHIFIISFLLFYLMVKGFLQLNSRHAFCCDNYLKLNLCQEKKA
jgi:hypothetical protein